LRQVNAPAWAKGLLTTHNNPFEGRSMAGLGRTTPIRILLVDDDEAVRESLGLGLETLGYQVGHASDGRAALAEVARHRPAAIVTDLQMSGMDGLDLLREMAMINRRVPVIAISGGSPEGLAAARRLGAAETLVKPVLDRDLASAIERCRSTARA
jgi:CheY-like chemotaxis protein